MTATAVAEALPVDDTQALRRVCAIVFLAGFVIFALSPVITNYDSYSSFPTAVSLLNRHTLSLDAYRGVSTIAHSYTVTRVHGELVTGYPWTVALFFLPSVAAVDLLHLLGGPSADHLVIANQMGLVQMETASLVTALACAALAWLAFERLSGTLRRRTVAAIACGLVFAFGTSAWSLTSRSMWQQAPGFLLTALALVQLNRLLQRPATQRRHAALAAVFLSLSLTVRPTDAIPLGVAFLALALWRRRAIVPYVAASAAVLVPWLLLTDAGFGTFLQPYDLVDHRSFQSVVVEALAANMVSPARGILIFSPLCLLAVPGALLARRAGRFDLVTSVSAVTIPIYWVVVSGFSAGWWGGNTYGPRLMSDTFPFFFVLWIPVAQWVMDHRAEGSPADRHPHRLPARSARSTTPALAAVAVAVFLSIAFNAEGGVLRSTTCWNGKPSTAQNVDNDPSRVWSWSDPQVLYGFRSLTTGSLHQSILSTCSTGSL